MYRYLVSKNFSNKNPFQSSAFKQLKAGGKSFEYYNINSFGQDVCKKLF
jgi:hypothetical protein